MQYKRRRKTARERPKPPPWVRVPQMGITGEKRMETVSKGAKDNCRTPKPPPRHEGARRQWVLYE
jgi:hypothetical protein